MACYCKSSYGILYFVIKCKVNSRTGQEDSKVEYRNKATVSLTSAVDGVGD